ncbi:MAG TPA: hypothetical protein ENK57_09785 [Polyangiaceae bacterium]|nr:hypothetical protein [Polyangiaceae bacterium]
MPLRTRHLLLSATLGMATFSARGQTTVPPVATDPPEAFQSLTNPLSTATNFNIETVRGMLLASDGLFAINTHGSTLVRYTNLQSPRWQNEWPTLHNPVAITEWRDSLLVVGGSSWSLAEHDRTTGRITRQVALAAEPADIVVDAIRDEAYVACQGDDVVVRIDLTTFTENARYAIPAERPRFLFLDELAVPTPLVYVAPFLSGNNTTLARSPAPEPRSTVLDLKAPGIGWTSLPDEDLFVIDPTQPAGSAVTPVLHEAGTLIAEHGRNPATSDYWVISTESLNAAQHSEDKHRGRFAKAQLTIGISSGSRPVPATVIDLDVPIGGGAKASATSMSFPFALAFHSTGYAAIASSTGDLITLLTPAGSRFFDIPVTQTTNSAQMPMPPQIGRAIPRDILIDSVSNSMFVYLWGWNKVFLYDLNNLGAAPFWLDLGPDPMPIAAQKGRSIFYDAKRPSDVDSQGNPLFHGAVTCNTCHPGGAMDLLGWELSDSNNDIKDLMVTQSLLSIRDTFPYHWRGERNLDHFNGAFVGLLGHRNKLTETPGGELDQLEAFIFSLQAPANPREDISRKLAGLDARLGQQVFLTKPNVLANFSCADCHAMPSGTNGERIAELFLGIASTASLDVAHLRQLRHKDQTPVSIVIPDAQGNLVTVQRARSGFGLAHAGVNFDIPDFIKPNVPSGGPFNITPQEQTQLSAFVRQFDQGIAPAAHVTYFMTPTNKATMSATVSSVLLTQAANGWIDVVVIGYEGPSGGVLTDLRWLYNPATGSFTSNHAAFGARSFATFVNAITGPTRYLFLGVPPGNGRRLAFDPDNDDLTDAQEAAQLTDPRNRDTDLDGYDDGYEVQVGSPPLIANVPNDSTPPALAAGTTLQLDHNTSTSAMFTARFNEPVTWQLDALDVSNGVPIGSAPVVSVTRGASLQREAMIHMHELYPSTAPTPGGATRSYVPRLRFTDPRGNTTTLVGAQLSTAPMLIVGGVPLPVTISSVGYLWPPARGSGSLSVSAVASVRYKGEPQPATTGTPVIPLPAVGKVVVARVLKRPKGSPTWSVSKSPVVTSTQLVPTFSLMDPSGAIAPYTALPGDFLLSAPTSSTGSASFTFQHSGLVLGDEVRLSIVAVLDPVAGMPGVFTAVSLGQWELPTTPGGATPTVPAGADGRGLTTAY